VYGDAWEVGAGAAGGGYAMGKAESGTSVQVRRSEAVYARIRGGTRGPRIPMPASSEVRPGMRVLQVGEGEVKRFTTFDLAWAYSAGGVTFWGVSHAALAWWKAPFLIVGAGLLFAILWTLLEIWAERHSTVRSSAG
jgi:hypothetical protein